MTTPTDFEILKIIRDHYYDAFISFDKNVPNRLSKIYVPIDIDLIAEKFGVGGDVIFGRLYYYLDKKYSYKNEDGSRVQFFANSLRSDNAKEKHLINFPLLDAIVSENIVEVPNEYKPDWYERILLALYERKNDNKFYNLFLLAENDLDKNTVREKAKELKRLIKIERTRFFNRGTQKYKNELNARIKLGGIEYVNKNILSYKLYHPLSRQPLSSLNNNSQTLTDHRGNVKTENGTITRRSNIGKIIIWILVVLALLGTIYLFSTIQMK
jgi:hypothetical protein